MKLRWVAAVAVMLGLTGALVWMFRGDSASNEMVANANVIGGAAAAVALALSLLMIFRWRDQTRTTVPTAAAADYLHSRTLEYWQVQAKARRVFTPSPVSVQWRWADAKVAVPADEVRPMLLTAGAVTHLREQLYERLGQSARIVLIGGPGAGKTTALMLLLIDVLRHRQLGSAQPVPVWLTMGGWNPATMSLLEWAAAVLNRDYPGISDAAELIRSGRVALFLDGLDEMPADLQGEALEKIDRDTLGIPVMLTSRPTEFQAAIERGRLWEAAVIEVLPVTVGDAAGFLLAEQLDDRRQAWQPVIDRMRADPECVAGRALTSPLALTLAREEFTKGDPVEMLDIRAHPTPEALLQHLLGRFLIRAYPDPAEGAHVTRWLTRIARHMGASRDLRWWDIPHWLPPRQRWMTLFAGVLAGGLAGLLMGLVVGVAVNRWDSGLAYGLAWGLTVGLMTGIASLSPGTTRSPSAFVVRWPDRGSRIFFLLLVIYALMMGLLIGIWIGLAKGVVVGIGITLFLLGAEFRRPVATEKMASPIELFHAARRCAAFLLITCGVFGFAVGLNTQSAGKPPLVLALGTLAGLMCSLLIGRDLWVQVFLCELGYRLRGQPVWFMPLLQAALGKQVLRQAGALYQFRHAALQDLLAKSSNTTEWGRTVQNRDMSARTFSM